MTSTNGYDYDVIVVGGGPAGSTAASLLSRDGHKVLLLEREKFPRDHVGESMLPFCYKLFDGLGVREEMERSFVRKPGVRFIDRNDIASTTWCFDVVIDDETYLSFQVNRAPFDNILLNNSRRLGAEVREQVKVTDIDLSDPNKAIVESETADGVQEVHTARFLIDASGRDAIVGSKNGWRKPREELDRTALWSHWEGVKMAHGLEEGLSLIIYIGEEKKGWIWVFPLSDNRITAGVVFQNSYIRKRRKELQAEGITDWQEAMCEAELRESPVVAKLLDTPGAHRVMEIMTNGNYSYEVTNHYGPNYAMIGDARGFIDPIFSSGVFLSMKTAHLVSAAVHNQLTTDVGPMGPELVEAYRKVSGAYNFVHRMIRLFYNPHAITWAEVGVDHQVHKRHESAMAAGHYMLAGDFFENHERYNKFFDALEDPRGFEHYKKLILDREDYNKEAPTCYTPKEVAFPMVANGGQKADSTVEVAG